MKNRIRNFQIQTKLGSGSYGVIYKALNKSSKEVCVLKQISLGRLNQKARKNAVNQATIMGKLTHPFIVRYQQSFIQENTLNIVMEFCDSGDLSNYLKLQNKKPLKEEKIWKFFIEICVGLQYIHKNKILHRDIKTLNIFMNKNDEIKIGDLGVAKMLNSNDFAQTMVGTPFYLSPQLCQQKPYNQKSDIWALGCLLYELCTFRHPFEAQNQPSLILKIIRGKYLPIPQFYSNQLKQLIQICLERDYKRRPTTSNLLAKPKMQEYYKQFGIGKIVDDYLLKIRNQKQTKIIAKPNEEPKSIPPKQKIVKAIEQESKKQVKKEQIVIKKEQVKRQQIKKQNIAKPPQSSQRKIQKEFSQLKKEEVIVKKDSKQQFSAKLQKLIDQSNKRAIKQGPTYAEIQPKINEVVKKQQKYQKVFSKVQEIKKDQKNVVDQKSPIMQNNKKYTPVLPQKKSTPSIDVAANLKKLQPLQQKPSLIKPALSKPPLPLSANKQAIKVKNEKIIQPKVYQSQKAVSKPVIKSAGFSHHLEIPAQKVEKPQQPQYSNSKEKIAERNIVSAKRPSVPGLMKQEKIQKDEIKQLFGAIQSPLPDHKSQKHIKNPPSALQQPKLVKKEQSAGNVSRVRKGGQNILSRNARNASRYNQISKQQKDQVMNLPNKINNKGNSSSDSQEQISSKRSHKIEDAKGKTNKNFKLKQIDNDLVLQKYEDLIKNQSQHRETVPDSHQEYSHNQIQASHRDSSNDVDGVVENEDENIAEDLDYLRKNSGNSDEQIEELLESEYQQEDYLQKNEQQREYLNQEQAPYFEKQQEWSFDQEPELPLLEQKQSPYFQENNPYLVEEQQQQQTKQESEQSKKNYLQTKLTQNLKREDQINKLMQIKIDQCRKFIGNQKNFQEILVFFRKKLNMDEEYNEQDQKEIENFLKKKGLTDHRKFQNIYKIMHFEMQLQNTRTIIQRICKKLNEFQAV